MGEQAPSEGAGEDEGDSYSGGYRRFMPPDLELLVDRLVRGGEQFPPGLWWAEPFTVSDLLDKMPSIVGGGPFIFKKWYKDALYEVIKANPKIYLAKEGKGGKENLFTLYLKDAKCQEDKGEDSENKDFMEKENIKEENCVQEENSVQKEGNVKEEEITKEEKNNVEDKLIGEVKVEDVKVSDNNCGPECEDKVKKEEDSSEDEDNWTEDHLMIVIATEYRGRPGPSGE